MLPLPVCIHKVGGGSRETRTCITGDAEVPLYSLLAVSIMLISSRTSNIYLPGIIGQLASIFSFATGVLASGWVATQTSVIFCHHLRTWLGLSHLLSVFELIVKKERDKNNSKSKGGSKTAKRQHSSNKQLTAAAAKRSRRVAETRRDNQHARNYSCGI